MYRQGQAGAEGRREQRTPGHGESAAGTDWSDLGNAEGERKKQGRNRTNEGVGAGLKRPLLTRGFINFSITCLVSLLSVKGSKVVYWKYV